MAFTRNRGSRFGRRVRASTQATRTPASSSSCGAQPAAPPRRMSLQEAQRGRALSGCGSQEIVQLVIQARRGAVLDLQAHHREQDPRVARQLPAASSPSERSHSVRARSRKRR